MSEPLHKLVVVSDSLSDIQLLKNLAERIGLKPQVLLEHEHKHKEENWNFDTLKMLKDLRIEDEDGEFKQCIETAKIEKSKLRLIQLTRNFNGCGFALKESKEYIEAVLYK